MTAAELIGAIDAGCAPTILDVRSSREFARGHVPGAIHVPFHQVEQRIGSLPAMKDDPLLVYCGHGPRAWIAGALLRRRGFRHVSYLKGHMSAWRRAGLPQMREERRTI